MIQRVVCLSAFVALFVAGCDIKSNRREPSVLEFSQAGAVVDRFLPIATALMADGSPRACEDEGCPTLAEALGPHFATGNLVTIPGLLHHVDERIAAYKARIVDHSVPCLDSSGVSLASELTASVSMSSLVHCFGEFEGAIGNLVIGGFEQFHFSNGKGGEPSTAIVRMGASAESVTTLWMSIADDGTASLWLGANRPLSSEGRALTGMVISPSGTLEMTTAGLEQYTGDNLLTCGAHLRMNGSRMLVLGRFLAPLAGSRSNTDPCALATVATFCLNLPGLTATDTVDCTRDGLDTQTLTSLQSSDLNSEEWGTRVYVNYSNKVPRFTMEGLEKI